MRKFVFYILVLSVLSSFTFKGKGILPTVTHFTAEENINLDFTLHNKTGYAIENVYVSPSNEKDWGEDVMGKDVLDDGESVEITFDGNEKTKKWDIYVTWLGYESDEDRYWTGFDLSKISEITLYYDHKSGKTWAEWK